MGFVGGGQIQGFAGWPAEVAAALPQGSLWFCLFFVCRLSLQQTVVQKWHIDSKLSFESCIGVPSFE